MSKAKVSGAQIRAARGFLNWSRGELAKASGVSVPTIQAIETTEGNPAVSARGMETTREYRESARGESITKLVTALVKAGVTFQDDDGRRGAGLRCRE